jgi:hypothetical protein
MKKGVLQLALQLNFWVASDTYNSPYIQCNSIQLCHNNVFSSIMQLPYDYIHNVMLTSFFIHPSKFNMRHYEDFSWFFLKYWYPSSIMIIRFQWSWIMTHGIIKSFHVAYYLKFGNKYIYIYIYIYT